MTKGLRVLPDINRENKLANYAKGRYDLDIDLDTSTITRNQSQSSLYSNDKTITSQLRHL